MTLFNTTNYKAEDIVLRRISKSDSEFVNNLFRDEEVKQYYIVPKEAQQNYRMLIDYWLHDIGEKAGCAWVIIKEGGFFQSDKKCGFVAFEYRNSLENARISYALSPQYRGKGLASKAVSYLIKILDQNGVKTFEADVDVDNYKSASLVEGLGFSAKKDSILIDPEMFRNGTVRHRYLWKKDTRLKNVEKTDTQNVRLGVNASSDQIITELKRMAGIIERNGQHPNLIARYLHLQGRLDFTKGDFATATQSFGQSNMCVVDNRLPDIYENFYWFARMKELQGESRANVDMYYDFALEKYYDSPEMISREEILVAKDRL